MFVFAKELLCVCQVFVVRKCHSELLFAWFLFTLGFDFLGPYIDNVLAWLRFRKVYVLTGSPSALCMGSGFRGHLVGTY